MYLLSKNKVSSSWLSKLESTDRQTDTTEAGGKICTNLYVILPNLVEDCRRMFQQDGPQLTPRNWVKMEISDNVFNATLFHSQRFIPFPLPGSAKFIPILSPVPLAIPILSYYQSCTSISSHPMFFFIDSITSKLSANGIVGCCQK